MPKLQTPKIGRTAVFEFLHVPPGDRRNGPHAFFVVLCKDYGIHMNFPDIGNVNSQFFFVRKLLIFVKFSTRLSLPHGKSQCKM